MADMKRIKGRIAETIYPNGTGAITAESHQALLLEMVDDINAKKADKEEVITVAESVSILSQEVESNRINFTESLDALEEKVDNLPQGGGDVKADGVYPDLTAGDLAGRGESVPAEFGFRASGGKSIKDGRAYIKRIKGNSVVWNQLLPNSTIPVTSNATRALNEGTRIVVGHKYLLLADFGGGTDYAGVSLFARVSGESKGIVGLANNENKTYKFFTAEIGGVSNGTGSAEEGNIWQYFYFEGTTESITNTRLIDLTQQFQAGNEPTTIEEYNARKPIVADEYAYNEGQVIHCNTESIKSVGDNALNTDRSIVSDFDGSYGNYDFINTEDAFVGISADGYINKWAIDYAEKIEGGFKLHNNAGGYGIGLFVKALPNEEYSVSYASDNGRIAFGFYDKGKNFISYELWGNRFTTPSNCEYIMLCLRDNEVTNIDISFTDIMLTLVHSGWKQDTDAGYQPYWDDTLPLPIINKYFPQGMKLAGTAHDEIRFNKASGKWEYSKGKIKSVDLGNLDCGYYPAADGYPFGFFCVIPQGRKYGDKNILCGKYAFGHFANDKSIMGNLSGENIYIMDSAYTDVESFKASLQGVILYYESNNWEWVELDAEDQNFRDYYNVADFGTEQSQSNVSSAPFSADIIYQFNAVDMIREHEAEITELQKVIATMQAQLTALTNGGL